MINDCPKCRGFGYTKGSPVSPMDKLECPQCKGTGKLPNISEQLPAAPWPFPENPIKTTIYSAKSQGKH